MAIFYSNLAIFLEIKKLKMKFLKKCPVKNFNSFNYDQGTPSPSQKWWSHGWDIFFFYKTKEDKTIIAQRALTKPVTTKAAEKDQKFTVVNFIFVIFCWLLASSLFRPLLDKE